MGKNLIAFYGEAELMSRFGTTQPTIGQRQNELDFLWFAYGKENEINTNDLDVSRDYAHVATFRSLLRKEYGAFNVIIRGDRIRFKDEAEAVFLRLKYSKR